MKVFTLGAEGYGQYQHLRGMQEFYRIYRVDLVVLWHRLTTYVPITNHRGPVCNDWQQRYDDDVGYMRNEISRRRKAIWR